MTPAFTRYRPARARRGVTLSEVLVSLLVMSIGVVALATLFPISVLRSVQATQLTNATQLRYNFDGLTGPRPELIAGAGDWQPLTNYVQGDIVVPTTGTDRYYECMTAGQSGAVEPLWAGNTGQPTTENQGGTATPVWVTRRARVYMVDPLGWQERTEELRDLGVAGPLPTNQINIRNTFGRFNSTAPNPPIPTFPAGFPAASWTDSAYRLVRFRGGVVRPGVLNPDPSSSTFYPPLGSPVDIAAKIGARQLNTLPDSWVFQAETNAISLASSSPLQIDLNQNVTPTQLVPTLDVNADAVVNFLRGQPEQLFVGRAILTDATGKVSVIRPINAISIPSPGVERLELSGLPLPGGFIPTEVRVETFEERYSWMLAVRRQGSGAAYMNLVVFFRRNLDPQHELIHPTQFRTRPWPGLDNQPGVAGADDDGRNGVDDAGELGWTGSDDITEPVVVVQYNPSIPAGQKPFLKRGGYICDAQNNRWYRILSYDEVPDALAALDQLENLTAPFYAGTTITAGAPGAVVRLDTTILENSGYYTSGWQNANTPQEPTGGAILMPSIVDVYPLLPQLPWEN